MELFNRGSSSPVADDDVREHPPFQFPEHLRQARLPSRPQEAKCVGSTGTWIVTAQRRAQTIRVSKPFSGARLTRQRKYQTITLFNPFSKTQLHLPTLETADPEGYLSKVVLSSPPTTTADRRIALAACYSTGREGWGEGKLALARLGDASWRVFDPKPDSTIRDVIFYKERLYATTKRGTLLACDCEGDPSGEVKATVIKEAAFYLRIVEVYLVQMGGDLLQVLRPLDNTFEVYRLDLPNDARSERLWNLGDHSLFLGGSSSSSVVVRASDYLGLVKSNCIYFAYEDSGDCCSGVFHMEDQVVELLPRDDPTLPLTYVRAGWVVPAAVSDSSPKPASTN